MNSWRTVGFLSFTLALPVGRPLTKRSLLGKTKPTPSPIEMNLRSTGEAQRLSPRITLVIPSLSSGGAERVMSLMANHWAEIDWRVTMVTLSGAETDFFPMSARISRVCLRLEGSSSGAVSAGWRNIARVRALRSAIRSSRPDAVISFMESMNVLTLLATRLTATPVVVAERTDPREHEIGAAWSMLRKGLYPRAAALVVQTHGVLAWAVERVGAEKAHVIPNPVVQVSSRPSDAVGAYPQPFVLAMGRLTQEKGFDLLLRAFEKASRLHSDWSLVILGEGSERASLEQLAGELGIAARVHLPGREAEPATIMAQASLFVLSSRFEGFPNALLEAMACGLPVLSFDCRSGPGEIIRHGVDGMLVPPGNVPALADAMQELMGDPESRELLGRSAVVATRRFGTETVMRMWENLLKNLWEARR
jgi:GalNAc-alpha-(1->4)-GalNAc-alpha-(1->3)-diNAcBac-PP-undecaprenol alpha-1,4-N-acetyl-D-galactosaminyltransferase